MDLRDKTLSELLIVIILFLCFGGGYSLAFTLGCLVEWFLELDV